MKRGAVIFVCLSVILILSVSVVSAANLFDFFGRLIGIKSPFTAYATSGGEVVCYDSDGKGNFSVAGWVTINEESQNVDYCSGTVAYDYYCCEVGVNANCLSGGADSGITAKGFLPLTGNVVYNGDYVARTTSKDCADSGLECGVSGGGVCGCSPGSNRTGYLEPGVVYCDEGLLTCNSQGTGYTPIRLPVAVGDTCSDGLTCQPNGQCGQAGGDVCTDLDEDGYGNPGDSSCSLGAQTDCKDDNNAVNPGELEICGDGIDNNCVNGIDEGCVIQPNTFCGDNLIQTPNSNGVSEQCDGTQLGGKTCATQGFTGGTLKCTTSCSFNTTLCTNTTIQPILTDCTDDDEDGYVIETSASECDKSNIADFKGYGDKNDASSTSHPGADELCDRIDNDQNGKTDEGFLEILACGDSCEEIEAGCIEGSMKTSCEDFGKDTPSSGTCADTSDQSTSQEGDTCGGRTVAICGTNAGECSVGARYCDNGVWGACENEGAPTNEICDNLDNDCDGTIDEGCTTTGNEGDQQDQGSSNNQNNQQIEEESTSFWEKFFNFILAIFRVGEIFTGDQLTGHQVADISKTCLDSDGGINYFVKGTGSGLSNEKEIWFQDVCYEDSIGNQKDKCAGNNCFLSEKLCEGSDVKSELGVACEFGCVNGACVPEAASREACEPYFDRHLVEWVDPC